MVIYICLLVLKQGGTAVDAAIASGLCIGIIHGFATGKCISPSSTVLC